MPLLIPTRTNRSEPLPDAPAPRNDLAFYNGLGGFTPDGREYVITTTRTQQTPAPWVNVLANPRFGSVISESGLACTWSENAHEFRLTPWGNDPISDSRGEALYLRDEERGHFWSPTPQPCSGLTPYVTRHGFGYSVFEHTNVAFALNCGYMWLWMLPSSLACSRCLMIPKERAASLPQVMWNGCLEICGPNPPCISLLNQIPSVEHLLQRNPYSSEFPGGLPSLIRTIQTVP